MLDDFVNLLEQNSFAWNTKPELNDNLKQRTKPEQLTNLVDYTCTQQTSFET